MKDEKPKSGKYRLVIITEELKLTIDKMPKNGVYLFSDNSINRYRRILMTGDIELLSKLLG